MDLHSPATTTSQEIGRDLKEHHIVCNVVMCPFHNPVLPSFGDASFLNLRIKLVMKVILNYSLSFSVLSKD